MNKEDILKLSEELGLDKNIELRDIPELDLYMDQVIQLFESKFADSKRNKEEKLLTKTMINNYAKAKLLMSINKKKYSKDHLILMSLIYNLKGGLSIGDIKSSLNEIVWKFENGEEYDLRGLYSTFLEQSSKDVADFNSQLETKINEIGEYDLGEYEEKFMLLCSFINMSNMYRRMGEKLIDEYFTKVGEKK